MSDQAVNTQIVTPAEWRQARLELLKTEKALTREMDRVSALRRALPRVRVEKDYRFQGEEGELTLADLFRGRSQLIVYHFMYAPGWDEGCPGCSFLVDHLDSARQHFEHHDVKACVISIAPLAKLLPFKRRMGWTFEWVSSAGSDFNYDFGVSFRNGEPSEYNYARRDAQTEGEGPGVSVFYKDADGEVYHTYSTYARGGDILIGAHNWLDLTPKGRNEVAGMEWMTYHDQYEESN